MLINLGQRDKPPAQSHSPRPQAPGASDRSNSERREKFGGIWQITPNFAGVFPAYKKGQHDFLTMFPILPAAERLECEPSGNRPRSSGHRRNSRFGGAGKASTRPVITAEFEP
jgi:hypothetical protein